MQGNTLGRHETVLDFYGFFFFQIKTQHFHETLMESFKNENAIITNLQMRKGNVWEM